MTASGSTLLEGNWAQEGSVGADREERKGSRAPEEADSVVLAMDRIGEEKEDGIAKGCVSQTSVSCS